jgi:hypothetical protein
MGVRLRVNEAVKKKEKGCECGDTEDMVRTGLNERRRV